VNSANAFSGHFIEGRQGPLFILRRGPEPGLRCVILVPPFAEEMNKARRNLTLLSLRLARNGITTLLPDLYGTGDSGGDFVEADWSLWQDDLARTATWCRRSIGPITGLVAIRLGCALACDARFLSAVPDLSRSVFWQPVLEGSRYLNQFLRLRVAAAMANDSRESIADLRRELKDQGEVEVAGYRVSRRLAEELDQLAEPSALPAQLATVDWFEVVRQPGQALSASSVRMMETWNAGGERVRGHAVAGEPFWTTTEIVTSPELVERTAEVMSSEMSIARGIPQ
jgi:exosortase A-associated hydrolase 2